MRDRKLRRTLTVIGLVLMAAIGATAVGDEPCGGDWGAAGCTRNEDATAAWGRCAYLRNDVCYYCEYSCTGPGVSACGENADGSVQKCKWYQDYQSM
jgi:hypothetical protein